MSTTPTLTVFQRKIITILQEQTIGHTTPAWMADRVWPVKDHKEMLGKRRAKWQSMGGHLRRLERTGYLHSENGAWYLTVAGTNFKP